MGIPGYMLPIPGYKNGKRPAAAAEFRSAPGGSASSGMPANGFNICAALDGRDFSEKNIVLTIRYDVKN
jgi:hypothetical protein